MCEKMMLTASGRSSSECNVVGKWYCYEIVGDFINHRKASIPSSFFKGG